MKVKLFCLFNVAFPAVAFLVLGIAVAVNRAAGQSNSPAPTAPAVITPTDGPLSRMAMIGASVTAGYASLPLAGNSSQELCRLNHYVDAAITATHEPVRNFSSSLFFLGAENTGRGQLDSALQIKPTLVVGVDFLFWYCYGDRLTEPQRLELFDRGLKLLESVQCPLIVGDIPDASAATDGMLSASQVPARSTMEEANRRLSAWASGRPQVSVVRISTLMGSIGTGQEIVLHGKAVSKNQARQGFQPDHLHLMPAGCAILTEAILDSLPASDVAGKVLWDAGEIEQRARAEVAKAWPEVDTTGTVFDPSNVPVSGLRMQAFRTSPGGSPDIVSDAAGKYSLHWLPPPSSTNSRVVPILLARDTERNWAACAELSLSKTNVDLHLQPGLVLSGKIQNRTGQSLSGAIVQIAMEQAGPAALSRVTNGIKDDGGFVFRALPMGKSYRVQATSPGYERSMVVVSAEKTQTNRVELPPITLRLANQQLAGQVLDLAGQPIAGALVSVTNTNQPARPAIATDAGGHFVIKGLYEGPLNVRATFKDSNAASTTPLTVVVQAQAGDTNVIVKQASAR